MTELSDPSHPEPSRDDKLRAIAAVFGEAMAARIGASVTPGAVDAADADRLAWQTNRLIRHLRDRVDGPADSAARTRPTPTAARSSGTRISGTRGLPALAAGEDLAAEHPAVIAHILRGEAQHVRVSVLRALPGHVARAVIQRMRRAERGSDG